MDKTLQMLNELLVETFNEILKVEEQSLRAATRSTVTVTELHTLEAIGAQEPRTVSELATATHVTVSTMTIAVNRLTAKGYVERMREPADRRVVRARLTEKGRELAEAHRQFHERMVTAVAQRLDAVQLDALIKAVESLREFFSRETDRNFARAFENLGARLAGAGAGL